MTDWKRIGAAGGLAVALAVGGCKSNSNQPAQIVDANSGPDPAAVNEAPVSGSAPAAYENRQQQSARVLGQQSYAPQAASGEVYPQGPTNPDTAAGYDASYDQTQAEQAGEQALYADQAPPPLPEYQQPELTQPGDIWTPGYWAYAPQGYYWVPGAWVAPPYEGALWTPGYWAFSTGRYRFHFGFWGRHVGFYGGVPYGYGYTGHGYEGGYWNQNRFYYNNAVNRVNVNTVRNVYVRNVTDNNTVVNHRVSYNGPGGWQARPTASDVAVLREQRTPPMRVQQVRAENSATNRQQFYAENHGRPQTAVIAEHQAADRTPPAPYKAVEAGPVQVRPVPTGAQPLGGPVRPNGFGQNGTQEQNRRVQEQNARQQHNPQPQPQSVNPQQVRQPQVQPRQQPEPQQVQPQQQVSPAEERRGQQARSQPNPVRPNPSTSAAQPRGRRDEMQRPQAAPQNVPQPQPAPRAQQQPRPEAPAPRPQPEARPQGEPHPQAAPQTRPEPGVHENRHEEKPK